MRCAEHWEKIGLFPHHGAVIPLFSIHSKKSSGIGEFLDLIPMIDWCKNVGFDVIQLLPLNDTGTDPSPYNPLSSCALDPVYLSLADLPDAGSLLSELDHFQSLSSLPRLAWNEVKHQKINWLKRYFDQTFPLLKNQESYQKFLQKNRWLSTYALFKSFKDEYGGKRWLDWPFEYRTYHEKDLIAHQKSVDFHSFLQFHCFSQMEKVKNYASKQTVFLKGDVPILLSPDSVDVWANPSLFRLDLAAGAPPDYYNRLGQKWGFPLFNWEAIQNQNYAWWKERLSVAEQLFHIYRIDHVVGFFRIWGIPEGKKAAEGSFFPPNPIEWPAHGREILSMMIDSCSLLPIAEDLGTIPKEVYPVLQDLGICGTKVIRWQRRWESDKSYIPYSEYNPLSLTTLSTQDSDTLTVWWKKFPDEAIPFAHFKKWNYRPDLTEEERLSILKDAHHTPSYFHINLLQEYLAFFPDLVSPNPEDERINIPGTQLPTNWTYRFRPSTEELLRNQPLAEKIREILLPT